VDGELFATGITFNGLQSIIRSAKNVDEKISKRMHYHIFDVISDKPWSERREYVSMIEKSYVIRPVKDYLISPSQLEEYHDKFVENGAEGIILRLPDKGYANKRTSALIKYKHFFDEEYLTVGFTCEKNHKDLLGAITLKLNKDSDVTFNARPSTTDEELKYIWEHKDEYIGKMATIRYQEKDKESNIPRFGILKGWKCESDLDLD
jgi:DNA ligase-1